MKAAVYYQNGGPEVFRYEDVPYPTASADQVIIKVKAISIEGGDLINRESRPLFHVPNIVGYQSAGEIVEVGSNVKDRLVGQRVVSFTSFGSHAEFVAADGMKTFLLPENLSYEQASVIPSTFFTAHECLFTYGKLVAGQTVLIHGGYGALGMAAIQLAKRAGANVISTGSDNEKLDMLKSLGSDHQVNYKESKFDEAVMEITSQKGADVVVDSIGGKNLSQSLQALSYSGTISFVGFSGRDDSLFNPRELWAKNAKLIGFSMFSSLQYESEHFRDIVTQMIQRVADGELQVVLGKTFPLSQAREAHEYILAKQAFGRTLLIPENN